MRLTVDSIKARLSAPWQTGHGAVTERELLLVRLDADDGHVGYGEAAPLASYDGVSVAEVRAALQAARPVLESAGASPGPDLRARLQELITIPPALAALDMALWDLEGRRAGEPVWRRLGAGAAEPVAVNWTVASADRAGAAGEAQQARTEGFGTLKCKVAIGDDAGRLAAVRAVAGPAMKIRIDANGAWSPAEARAALRVLGPVGIELCEQPVAGVAAVAELSHETEIPLALDESAAAAGALERRACDLVCLKVGGCGGLTGVLAAARRARATGYEVYLASTLDGPLGIAAALHAAAALGPLRACGLNTLPLYGDRPNPLPASAGAIGPPVTPGLGDGLLGWYRAG
ncbi:MAG TPA: enolase C-terminal domain-like protein [Solirubrobacteraceae bacterium]